MCFKKWFKPDEPVNNPDMTNNTIIHIACGNYPGSVNDLAGPPNDQVDFRNKMNDLFPHYVFRRFLDKQATRQRFLDEVQAVVDRMQSGDTLVFIMDTCFSETNTRRLLPANMISSRVYHNPDYPVHQKFINRVLSPDSDHLRYISMSACQDHETAADAYFNGRANGAYHYALMETMIPGITYREWDGLAGAKLRELGFPQTCTIEGPDELIDRMIFEGTVYCIVISSHGSHVYDTSGDEPDSQDEGPYLYDGMILDDDIAEILQNIPK